MHDTTTPSLATHLPMWRRRLLATALIIAAGTALGVGATGLTSDGGRRGDPPAGDAKDHPNYGPVDTTTTWTGDAKDHPNYGPVDTLDRRHQGPPQLRPRRHVDRRHQGPPQLRPRRHVDRRHQGPPQLRPRRHVDRRRQGPPQLRPRRTGESLPLCRRRLPAAAHPGDRSSHRCRRQRDVSRSRTGTFVGENRSTSSGSVVRAGRVSPHPWRPVAAHGAVADAGECRTTRPNDSAIGPSSAPDRHLRDFSASVGTDERCVVYHIAMVATRLGLLVGLTLSACIGGVPAATSGHEGTGPAAAPPAVGFASKAAWCSRPRVTSGRWLWTDRLGLG